MGFYLIYHADSAIAHTLAAFFSLFSKHIPVGRNTASLLAGRFEKIKKAASVCAIALSAWYMMQIFFSYFY